MINDNVTELTSLLFRFYAKSLAFPYDEMKYELQHIFREMERCELEENDDWTFLETALSIVNSYQGEEISDLREEYVRLFGNLEDHSALCPLYAGDFLTQTGRSVDIFDLEELFWESGLTIDGGEPADALPNLLDYLAIYCESASSGSFDPDEFILFLERYIIPWVPQFCDRLHKAAGLTFYSELAGGLKQFLEYFNLSDL